MSTWRQPVPDPASAERSALVAAVASEVVRRGTGRLRAAVDGRTGAGKTSFAHELASAVRDLGRPTLRASLDDFKRPWREATELGYDRVTGPGLLRERARPRRGMHPPPRSGRAGGQRPGRALRPRPAHPGGPPGHRRGRALECGARRRLRLRVPAGVGPLLGSADLARHRLRGVHPRFLARDTGREGAEEAARLDRERYRPAEEVYLAQVAPAERADIVVDNRDLTRPRLLQAQSAASAVTERTPSSGTQRRHRRRQAEPAYRQLVARGRRRQRAAVSS